MGFFAKSCFVAGSISSQSFPDFLNLSESCQEKAVFVQHHNTSLFEVPSNGAEVNTERSQLHTNWHLTRTVYHWSLILRSFRAKPKLNEDNADGFVKALWKLCESSNILQYVVVGKCKFCRLCLYTIQIVNKKRCMFRFLATYCFSPSSICIIYVVAKQNVNPLSKRDYVVSIISYSRKWPWHWLWLWRFRQWQGVRFRTCWVVGHFFHFHAILCKVG